MRKHHKEPRPVLRRDGVRLTGVTTESRLGGECRCQVATGGTVRSVTNSSCILRPKPVNGGFEGELGEVK